MKISCNIEKDIQLLVNKQLNDKERYLAAFENPDILNFLNNCDCQCIKEKNLLVPNKLQF